MNTEVRVPKWGLTVEDVEIIDIAKQVGDRVALGEAICTVETDKTTADIESTATGTVIELCCAVGDVLAVGALVARVSPEPD
jgi:pyruvate/2-oxoglutarate dehydrogenase complex dihydrolipoamide acyltransferase (E2) component